MKKFVFPLRSVATVRNIAELRSRERFSARVQAFAEAQARLQALRERLADYEKRLVAGRGQIFRPMEEAGFLNALKQETARAKQMEAEVEAARQALETARQVWLESRRDVKIVEKLEAKARLFHAQEVQRENQSAMDDRSNAIAGRAAATKLT